MLIMNIFRSKESYERVKSTYSDTNIEFSNNINSIDEARGFLINSIPDIVIVDSNVEWSKETIVLISERNKNVKIIPFVGNFDVLNNRLEQEIRNFNDSYKENVSNDSDVKYVFINDKSIRSNTEVVEKVVEKEVIVEKPVFIEKEILKVVSVKSNSVISFISNSSNGKSYVSWNLAHALAKNELKVAYVNIDSINSANSYFGIDEEMLPFSNLEKKTLKEIIDEGIQINNNLTVYTGEFGTRSSIRNDMFLKVLNHLRSNNNIVILDTATGFSDNLLTSINNSNDIVIVYDLDNSHLKLNDLLIRKLKGQINLSNSIAIINNCYTNSKELKNISKHLEKMYEFKDIVNISNCGSTTYDYMYSNSCNYLEDNNEFTNDLDSLMRALNLEVGEKENKKKSFLNIFWR